MMRRGHRGWLAGWIVLLLFDAIAAWWWLRQRKESSFDRLIQAAALRYGIDPHLVKAVAWRESRFNPLARGQTGELGLMQIREPAARDWAEAEKFPLFSFASLEDPGTNTLCGAWYLSKLLKRYETVDDPLPYALADYNAGRSHVLRWNNGAGLTNSSSFLAQITFPGTRDYIRSVSNRRHHYAAGTPGPLLRSAPRAVIQVRSEKK